MNIFLEMLSASLLFIGFYFIVYHGAFYVCLSDDVEFRRGKKRMRNRRRKQKGLWRKLLFLDIREDVVPWHYAMFWVNLVSFIASLIMLNVYIACGNSENGTVRLLTLIPTAVFFLSTLVILSVRWPLYAWNKIRSRKNYRGK